MSMSMSSCVYYASTRLIRYSGKEKNDIRYMDTILKVAPRMFDVIELLINNIPKDKLGDIYDDIEYLSSQPALVSECSEEDIWGRDNDWIDILEELEEEGDDHG